MSEPRRAALVAAAFALAASGAGCGPYPDIAQRFDVTRTIDGGETWLAADGDELRVLVLGPSSGGVPASFSYAALRFPDSAGTSGLGWQGEWTDRGATVELVMRREYRMPEERSTSLLARVGVTRRDVSFTLSFGVTRGPGTLALAGDARVAGTYARLPAALGRLGVAAERDAACAFQIVNLGIRATELRVLGFGGPGMSQYTSPATYAGTLGGSFTVSLPDPLDPVATFTYADTVELSGVRFAGPQVSDVNRGGDGSMRGVMTFEISPADPDGAALPAISGTIDFGGAGNPADAVQIRSGNAVGGSYVTTLGGGAIARVPPATAPSPPIRECLTLP